MKLKRGAVQLNAGLGGAGADGAGEVQLNRGALQLKIGVEALMGGNVQLNTGGFGGGKVQLKRGADQLKRGGAGRYEGERPAAGAGQHVQLKRGGSVAFEDQVKGAAVVDGAVKFQFSRAADGVGVG